MFRTLARICVPLVLVAALGCGESRSQQKAAAQAVMDVGKIENGVYTNAFFSVSIPVPKDWYVTPNKTMEELQAKGAKMVAGDNKSMQAALEAAATVNLLGVFEKPPGTPMLFNPSFLSVAEKVTAFPGMKRGSDYLYQVRQQFSQSAMKVTISPETRTVDVGGKSFDVIDATMDMPTVKVHQCYYAAIANGYAICLIISYADDAQKAKVENVIKSITFTDAK